MELSRNRKWIEDLEELSLQLPKRHKNLFFSKNQEDFYEEIETLKRKVQYFDDYEMQVEIAKIVADIRDAHTSVSLRVRLICPFELYWFSGGIYVINTIPEYKDIQYCKLTDINDIPIDEIIDTLTSIISYENDSFLKSQLPKYLPAVEVLYGLEIVDEVDSLRITFEDRNKNRRELEIKSYKIEEVKEKLNKHSTQSNDMPLYRKNSHKYYWFKYIQAFNTVYFKYNTCREMENKSILDFGKELIEFINENDVDKLIIDMRNNFGGNSTLLDPFIKELKSCDKINKKNKLFVIVGRETFSSALLNAFSLKENTNAIFVGESTGGKPNCYGEVKRFSLKNSRLVVCYSTEYYSIIENNNQQSFVPDINIEFTIQNYIKNEDPYLKYLLI
jgi:hypothetical protein